MPIGNHKFMSEIINTKLNNITQEFIADAKLCENKCDWLGAIVFYRSALKIRPNYFAIHHNLAIALRYAGQSKNALKSAQFAATLAPDHPTVQFSLGVSLEKVGQTKDAIVSYKRSTQLKPNYIEALSNLGRMLEVEGQIIESIEILEKALALAPNSAAVLLNLANSSLLSGNPKRAQQLLKKLSRGNPDISNTFRSLVSNSLGLTAHVIGDRKLAIGHFRNAIDLAPDFAEAHENLAQVLLFEQKYEEAWVEYEWRWQNEKNRQSKRVFAGPSWQGESLTNKILLVHAEQGFGDVIQFVRFLSLIEAQKGRMILACHTALIDLFSSLDGVHRVINIDSVTLTYDFHAPLLSIPRILGVMGTNIPNKPYLSTKKVFETKLTKPIKVGITWAGMPRHEFDPHRNRSCPIEAFKILLKVPDIELFSLQTGPNTQELTKINVSHKIVDLNPLIHTFKDTSELISELDLVITIDTAVAHLAGAIGKEVWILLATCADWRWQDDNQNNPWYPTARLFRQKKPGNWLDPLNDVASELRRMIL
jgi:tetratricopeptide (TPR) repeat protein